VLAEAVREARDLDRVLFIPSSEPPLKSAEDLAPAADRLAMVEAAIADHAHFLSNDVEIRRGGKSYTFDTLQLLRKCYAEDVQWSFISGADAVSSFSRWHRFTELVACCEIIVATRPGHDMTDVPQGIRTITIPMLDISSTDIRTRCARGASIRYLVPPAVEAYIVEHHLYT
jgi:nicotinate-nucleotide adenylyltransferase